MLHASGADELWCNYEKALTDMIGRDMTLDELASIANEQRKVAIIGPYRRSKKQGVEFRDAKQFSSDASKQQHMESLIDGERRQTRSLVLEDLREADRQINTRGERFGTFSDESLGHLLLSVEED